LASFVLLYQIIEEGRPARTWNFLMAQIPSLCGLAPLMVVGAAFLMVSTIPYPAFKQMSPLRLRSAKGIMGLVALAAVVWAYPQTAAFVLFFAYTLLGPVGWIVRLLRRLLVRVRPKPAAGVPKTLG
jgi:phosphatidylserine synthase